MSGRPSRSEADKKARGARLRALRERVWGSQEDASEALSVPRVYFPRYEHGVNAMSTSEAKRPIAVGLGVRTDDLEHYLSGDIELDTLLKMRRDPEGNRVLDPDDPADWAAIVAAIGKQLGKEEKVVRALISTEMKRQSRIRIDQVATALDALEETLGHDGVPAPSESPPFLSAKRRRS